MAGCMLRRKLARLRGAWRRPMASTDGSAEHTTYTVRVPAGQIGIVLCVSDSPGVASSLAEVCEVLPGSPLAGRVRPGDLLTHLDGSSLAGASHDAIVRAFAPAARRAKLLTFVHGFGREPSDSDSDPG